MDKLITYYYEVTSKTEISMLKHHMGREGGGVGWELEVKLVLGLSIRYTVHVIPLGLINLTCIVDCGLTVLWVADLRSSVGRRS